MLVLGIETSCDETAAAVAEFKDGEIKILSNIVSSQIDLHKKYGGVVPEVAAREHVLNIIPVVGEALDNAKIRQNTLNTKSQCHFDDQRKEESRGSRVGSRDSSLRSASFRMTGDKLDAIAVTQGPGLITSLMTGIETAKSLAYAWDKPLVGVNHIEGHIAANFVSGSTKSQNPRQSGGQANNKQAPNSKIKIPNIKLPAIVLTVSGGHTMLILMEELGKYKTIGETRDDAAGEAFDKAAKLMELGYPGGPAISAEAEKIPNSKHPANPAVRQIPNKSQIQNSKFQNNIILPRPMINSKDFDFSFSGLKTAIRYELEKDKGWKKRIPEYCHEFQQAIVDVLIAKTIKAAEKYTAKTIMLAGGVAANNELRKQLEKAAQKNNYIFKMPELKYTTDNAAMVAAAGVLKAERKEFTKFENFKVDCNLQL